MWTWIMGILRVVQTQAILFLKSMSEWVGSDIQRLWNWMMIFKIVQNRFKIQIQRRSMSDPPLSDINFKNKMALVWTTLKDINNGGDLITCDPITETPRVQDLCEIYPCAAGESCQVATPYADQAVICKYHGSTDQVRNRTEQNLKRFSCFKNRVI